MKTALNAKEQQLPHHHMIWVEGGTFIMGSPENAPESYDNEKPAHEVSLSDFYIGRYPVTQALWELVMGDNPAYFQGSRRPVEQVSWYDAVVFCNRLSRYAGRPPCYFFDDQYSQIYGLTASGDWDLPNEGPVFFNAAAAGYRLPTEAEWEYAARGGRAGEGYRYAGSGKLEEVGWFEGNEYEETREVGLQYPNELGLCDLSGNVWEWCVDWYDGDYYKACAESGTVVNPLGPDGGAYRVVRGGGYFNYPLFCRPANRYYYSPDYRGNAFGLRLVLPFQSVG